jgi:hypothetical protein
MIPISGDHSSFPSLHRPGQVNALQGPSATSTSLAQASSTSEAVTLPGSQSGGDSTHPTQQPSRRSSRPSWAQRSSESGVSRRSKSAPPTLANEPEISRLPEDILKTIVGYSLEISCSAHDVKRLRDFSEEVRHFVDDKMRIPGESKLPIQYTSDSISLMARLDWRDDVFREQVNHLAGRSMHFGINLSDIDNRGQRQIALNSLVGATQLHTVEIKEDGHSFQPTLTAIHRMAAHPQLTHVGLDVSNFRRFGRNGGRVMAVADNPAITKFVAQNSGLGDPGARRLAQSPSIRELDLSHNHISDQGALALAANSLIGQLDVSNNRIGDQGAVALAANPTITQLDVSNNRSNGA